MGHRTLSRQGLLVLTLALFLNCQQGFAVVAREVKSLAKQSEQASTLNVAGTRQADIAAWSLHELGQKLKGLVEQYRV